MVPPQELEFLNKALTEPEEAESSFDIAARGRFVLAVLRRRWRTAALVMWTILIGGYVLLKFLPRVYRVETVLLAQRNDVLPGSNLVGPTSSEAAPTKAASEMIHRRDNILALIKQAQLFKPSVPKKSLGERLHLPTSLSFLAGAGTEQDQLMNLVKVLDQSISVVTTESTITITLDWGDPQDAYRIVEAAVQNFLEVRQLKEITAVDDMISLLSGRAEELHRQLIGVMVDVDSERMSSATAVIRGLARRQVKDLKEKEDPSSAELLLHSTLEAKQRAIRDIEDFRRKRQAELQAQLDEKRGIYSDAFPSVVSLKQDIEALSEESPQLKALRDEVAKLTAQLAISGAQAAQAAPAPAAPEPHPAISKALAQETPDQAERIRDARFKYEQMISRINQAQLELDAARAGFKYRYGIVVPAEVPKFPIRPKGRLFMAGVLFVAVLLALLTVVLVERYQGIIHDAWQLPEILDVPLLAEMRKP